MELFDLEVFRAVVKSGGVIKAANRLHRVPSGVTTRIRNLEKDLGIQLFDRERNRLQISSAGETLLRYADQMLQLQSEAREALHDARPRGAFRLGSMETTAAVRLPAVLSELHRRYPDINIELTTGSTQKLLSQVLEGITDAAFVGGPVHHPGVESELIFREEVVVVAERAHPRIRSARDIASSSLLAFAPGCSYRKRAEEWFGLVNMVPLKVIELASYQAILSCAAAGTGIAVLPASVLASYLGRRHVTIHTLPKEMNEVPTALIWRMGTGGTKIRLLLEVLKRLNSFKDNPAYRGFRRVRTPTG
jgi:DNA-binding transcriptional LysR family regulator